MGTKSIYLFLVVFAWGLVSIGAAAEPLQQDPGPDGIISVEAEHYDEAVDVGTNTWEVVSAAADFTGTFSGGAAAQIMPDTPLGGRSMNEGFIDNMPRLDFQINFAKTGTHYVWVLAFGRDGNSDSCHIALDNEYIDTCDRMSGWNGSHGWSNTTMDGPVSTFEVMQPGLHTLNVYMREDGLAFDKIIVTTNPEFSLDDTDMGPEESPRGARVTASGASPSDLATDVPRDVALSWTPGDLAAAHDVYFGTSLDDVTAATRSNPLGVLVSQGQTATSYDPAGVFAYGQTYYWRVDEVNAAPDATIFPGGVWSFTVEPYTYPIENITATASSAMADAGPENTVNGAGLDAAGLHSDVPDDMWLTAPGAAGPAWIQYEFDGVYKLYDMMVWNYNVQFEVVLGYGFKDVTIEVSENGTDWIVLADVEFAKAPSLDGYASNTTIDLGGVSAQYLRLTANDNWGALAQYGLSEVRFTHIPVQASEPIPAAGAQNVSVEATLTWRAGREAAAHEIYLSTEEASVTDGTALVDTLAERTYNPGGFDFGQTYYWKVVEVNEAEAVTAWEGNVWSFATQEYVLVEGFEDYDDEANRIYETWVDGWVNETGSTVGYLEAPFAEQTITHGGFQSMPLQYNNADSPWYSEAGRTFATPQNWAANGADTLLVHFHGNPVDFLERVDGSIVMGAAGTDIWNSADEFRFVYKDLVGDASIVVRVDSVLERDPWTKAGVMIRESLDAGSKFAAVYITPGNGCRYHIRAASNAAATSDTSVATAEQMAITAPYWVKLERSGNEFSGFYSADGSAWTPMVWNPQTISMLGTIRIGLALTSHSAGNPTVAEFSGVATTGNVTGNWEVATIGVPQPSNDPDQLYVTVEDSAGRSASVVHPDPAATTAASWQAWAVSLDTLSAAGVNLNSVETVSIGVGDPDNAQAGGTGTMYIDDIMVGHPASVAEEAVE